MAESTLKKFIQDQEEAVQLARETVSNTDCFKVDAINTALHLANTNAQNSNTTITMEELLKDADKAEKWLRGTKNG